MTPDRRALSVTLPLEVHARLRAAAGPRGMSGFVRDAVEARLAEVENGEAVQAAPSMSQFVAELAGVADAVDLEERPAAVAVKEVPEGTCPHCGSVKSLLVIGQRRRCYGCGAMFGGYGP